MQKKKKSKQVIPFTYLKDSMVIRGQTSEGKKRGVAQHSVSILQDGRALQKCE